MKAAGFRRFGGPEVLEFMDLPDPHPGPGQVRIVVRAAGISLSDWKRRKGQMDPELPQTMGYEAAGIVDELGEGVTDAALGDRVFGACHDGAAQAELAVLSAYAPIPVSLGFAEAAALPAAIETAARALDQLGVESSHTARNNSTPESGNAAPETNSTLPNNSAPERWSAVLNNGASRSVGSGRTVLINGASGSVGSAAVQLAVARGARVIGTAGPTNHDYLRSLGAEPVTYGEGLAARVREIAPDGVDLALDVAGSGVLPELIELAGGPDQVLTVADFEGAQRHGVRFSRGDSGRALYVLTEIGAMIDSGRFAPPVVRTFPLTEVAEAHRLSESGHARGKLVLLIG